MNTAIEILKGTDWLSLIGATVTVLSALAALFALIPGEQPEKTFRKLAEMLSKFSRK